MNIASGYALYMASGKSAGGSSRTTPYPSKMLSIISGGLPSEDRSDKIGSVSRKFEGLFYIQHTSELSHPFSTV